MEVAPAVETRRDRLTPLERIKRGLADFLVGLGRMALLASVLTPILIASFLTLDVPVRGLDYLFTSPSLRPGAWLTIGHIVMAFGAMVAVLFSRRFGGDEAARAVTAAWGVAALAAFAEFAYLAPNLNPGDLPSARFVGAFVASAMVGQYVAAAFYDIIRGGPTWWRAPFYALLAGFFVHVAIFYPSVYWSTTAPWLNWMVTDFAIKAVMGFGFLGVYFLARRRLKPRGGLGG